MTSSIVEALEFLQDTNELTAEATDPPERHGNPGLEPSPSAESKQSPEDGNGQATILEDEDRFREPVLLTPKVGNPISHGHVIDIARRLKGRHQAPNCRLEALLKGSKVYIPPPKPKAEPVIVCTYTLRETRLTYSIDG